MSNLEKKEVHHSNFIAMGTRFDMVVAGIAGTDAQLLFREIRYETERIESLLSPFRSGSLLNLVNTNAYGKRIKLDEEMRILFRELIHLHVHTDGMFDISLSPLYSYLKDRGDKEVDPPKEILDRVGMDKLDLNDRGLRFRSEGMQLDPGGFGKGYAVKRILPLLKSRKVEHALVSFGESLVYGFGNHPYGETWKIVLPVGMTDPPVCELKDEALSVSGNSLNNRKKFGNSGHIIHPCTFRINRERALICVKHEDPLLAEVFSTALFAALGEEGELPGWAKELNTEYIQDQKVR